MSSDKLIPQSSFEITNLRAISSQGEKFSSYRASKTLSHRQRRSCDCRSRHRSWRSGRCIWCTPWALTRPRARPPLAWCCCPCWRWNCSTWWEFFGPGQSPLCTQRGPCTRPSRGCSVPSEDSHEAPLLIRGSDTHQDTEPKVQHLQSPSWSFSLGTMALKILKV